MDRTSKPGGLVKGHRQTREIKSSNASITKPLKAIALAAIVVAIAGCASTPLLIANLSTTAVTGKSMQDHGLSLAKEEDCHIVEGVIREDRMICEEKDSEPTKRDFQGLAGFFEKYFPATDKSDERERETTGRRSLHDGPGDPL